jgi:hypothetical protein
MNRLHILLQCLVIHKKMAKDRDFFWLPYWIPKIHTNSQFTIFFWTTTMGDNHVASSIG